MAHLESESLNEEGEAKGNEKRGGVNNKMEKERKRVQKREGWEMRRKINIFTDNKKKPLIGLTCSN